MHRAPWLRWVQASLAFARLLLAVRSSRGRHQRPRRSTTRCCVGHMLLVSAIVTPRLFAQDTSERNERQRLLEIRGVEDLEREHAAELTLASVAAATRSRRAARSVERLVIAAVGARAVQLQRRARAEATRRRAGASGAAVAHEVADVERDRQIERAHDRRDQRKVVVDALDARWRAAARRRRCASSERRARSRQASRSRSAAAPVALAVAEVDVHGVGERGERARPVDGAAHLVDAGARGALRRRRRGWRRAACAACS